MEASAIYLRQDILISAWRHATCEMPSASYFTSTPLPPVEPYPAPSHRAPGFDGVCRAEKLDETSNPRAPTVHDTDRCSQITEHRRPYGSRQQQLSHNPRYLVSLYVPRTSPLAFELNILPTQVFMTGQIEDNHTLRHAIGYFAERPFLSRVCRIRGQR